MIGSTTSTSSADRRDGRGTTRTLRTLAAAGATTLALGLAACSSGSGTSSPDQGGQSQGADGGGGQQASSNQPVQFDSSVADKATDVPVNTEVTAGAQNGTLSTARLTYVSKPHKSTPSKTVDVPGTIENGSWKAGDLLKPGVTYTLHLTAKDSSGATKESTRTFQTKNLSLEELTYVKVEPSDGTVGIGMPVIVTFDVPVKDHKNFEKHLKVTSTPAQEGAWRWISDKEVHWRPAKYWKPGTKVHVEADLNGQPAGGGVFGEQDRTADFTIGRSVIARPNYQTHQMSVAIDGKVVRTMPITGGKPGLDTRSGVKVIMNKVENITMRAETIGYQPGDPNWYPDSKVRYALQLTNSGEFIHTATWSVWAQGSENVSHGCTGMNTANSGWVFDTMKVGDVVIASGTDRKMTLGNGIADWNLTYDQWKSGADIK